MDEKEINRTFARTLRYYLELNDMRQYELAKRLGVGSSTVNDWVNARKTPRMDKVDKMCDMFNCRRSDFLEDKKNEDEEIILKFRSLNPQGQEKVREYIDDLIDSGKYKKHDFDEMVDSSLKRCHLFRKWLIFGVFQTWATWLTHRIWEVLPTFCPLLFGGVGAWNVRLHTPTISEHTKGDRLFVLDKPIRLGDV